MDIRYREDRRLDYRLMDNAKDSLQHAVEHLVRSDDASDLKRVILDVFHAMELLLKEGLQRINPVLVCSKIDGERVNYSKTVSVDVAINRLRNLLNNPLFDSISPDIEECKKIRNQIMHYEFKLQPQKAKYIIYKMLSSIFLLSKNFLEVDLESDFKCDKGYSSLMDIYEFWELHGKRVERDLVQKGIKATKCPFCNSNTFDLSKNHCLSCSHDDAQVKCDRCGNKTWKGMIHYWDEPTDESIGIGPHTKEVCLCNKCYSSALDDAYVDYYEED